MSKQFVFDYEQTGKILARRVLIDQRLEEMMERHMVDTWEELKKRLNQHLYELAEKQGMSLYDICFNYIPGYEYDFAPDGDIAKYEIKITLIPAKLSMEPEKRWISVSDRLPDNDALSVLRCHHPTIEGGWELHLGYFDGEFFYTKDRQLVYPTHYMPIRFPKEEE